MNHRDRHQQARLARATARHRDRLAGGTVAGALLATALMAIATASPGNIPVAAASADVTAASVSADVTLASTLEPCPTCPEPTNLISELFYVFRTEDLAFNGQVQQALGGTLPASGVPPVTPADALVYDVEAPGNLLREDLEALVFSIEYLSQGDFGQAGAIVAPVPVDTLQGPVVFIDTNLTGLAEAIGVPAADISAVNNAVYEPIISLDTTLENELSALGSSLPNLHALPDSAATDLTIHLGSTAITGLAASVGPSVAADLGRLFDPSVLMGGLLNLGGLLGSLL